MLLQKDSDKHVHRQTQSVDNYTIDPFYNVSILGLPEEVDSRFGLDQFRQVMELQVGSANNEANPKILRVNQQGQWMGQPRFVFIPNEPVNTQPIKYQVDMLGNITATSFKTAGSGQRVRIVGNSIEVYDANDIERIHIADEAIDFFDFNGIFVGSVFGSQSGSPKLILLGSSIVALGTSTALTHLFLDDLSATSYWIVPMVLAGFPADPPAINGSMYYNTITDKSRVCEAGVWQDIV